ncbi:VOC family protein [Adhaeribacter swui]|uniref:VOC family protein n=1 Tax=Adhaeribacter swui TaxID=2086471 RepID=A0A7G7G968_9BACT|nr:VOC family protein [Adhaeribacter swui]QNF33702.1 VOC family protein [Adhaeribacter swui]
MLTVLELNHVALHVQDVAVSCRFYGELLGFRALPRPAFDFPGAWFALGPHQELHLIGDRALAVHSHHRGNHFALKVATIKETEEHLRAAGLTFMGPKKRPDGMWQIFLTDPDGHVLEFTELPD